MSKSFGPTEVLRPTTMTVEDGGFLTIDEPSGCGKTTILRLIDGFADPNGGQVVYDARDIVLVPNDG